MTQRGKKLVILSAPSGSGKTTIMKQVREILPQLEFSISATSRAPRYNEKDGIDYDFITVEEFDKLIEEDKFVEWEEVYAGTKYGTLRSEMERIWAKGHTIIFDIDVKGGLRLKRIFGERALSIFIMPPSLKELNRRLVTRGTDSKEAIEKRVARASEELGYADQYDVVVVNDLLPVAVDEVRELIEEFI